MKGEIIVEIFLKLLLFPASFIEEIRRSSCRWFVAICGSKSGKFLVFLVSGVGELLADRLAVGAEAVESVQDSSDLGALSLTL